jgi:threonylcarbamoyladenosine tRNA methylthiotransferase MtaB
MPTAAYHTLGCKVNQYETEQIRLAMERAGFATVSFSAPADVYIVNTCSVTAVADSKSRAAIRKVRRLNPAARIVVTGCLAQLEPDDVASLDSVDFIVPNSRKSAIPSLIGTQLDAERNLKSSIFNLQLRTRALVKVQDGCDHFCAYCIVPYARPGMSSRPVGEVLDELRSLAESGYREVVLAGIRLGSYDHEGLRLPGLIRKAVEIEGIQRIRLSSIEPWEVDDALLDAMQDPKVCRHLHIPLQSGDDSILAAMGRPYDAGYYECLVSRCRERVKGIGITTDVIVGFPGEADPAFQNTADLIQRVGFSRLHVFRYSPRKRTRAASMPGQVDAATKKQRSEHLIGLGRRSAKAFAESLVGRTVEVLVERELRTVKQLMGYADNYAEVVLPGDAGFRGRIVRVRITGVDDSGRALGNAE